MGACEGTLSAIARFDTDNPDMVGKAACNAEVRLETVILCSARMTDDPLPGAIIEIVTSIPFTDFRDQSLLRRLPSLGVTVTGPRFSSGIGVGAESPYAFLSVVIPLSVFATDSDIPST